MFNFSKLSRLTAMLVLSFFDVPFQQRSQSKINGKVKVTVALLLDLLSFEIAKIFNFFVPLAGIREDYEKVDLERLYSEIESDR